MITNEFINAILTGVELPVTTKNPYTGIVLVGGEPFDRADRAAIKWQYSKATMGSFEKALWGAIENADEFNLLRLERGFPEELQGFKNWTRDNLATRLQAAAELFEQKRGER